MNNSNETKVDKKIYSPGPYAINPVNKNIIYSTITNDTLALVLSGKVDGLSFPEERITKHYNAKLFAISFEMIEFLKEFHKLISENKNPDNISFGNTFNEQLSNGKRIGDYINELINRTK